MSRVSKIVATTLNNPLSPSKTFDFGFFQIPKNYLFQTLKIYISNPQENLTLALNDLILDTKTNPYLAPKNPIP
jgi:hypothetical protein